MKREQLLDIIREASIAPSVHNIQPIRWKLDKENIILCRDHSIKLIYGDPTCRDINLSIGIALEGVSIAASLHGYSIRVEDAQSTNSSDNIKPCLIIYFEPGAKKDPLADYVQKRTSWRGKFVKTNHSENGLAAKLKNESCAIFNTSYQLEKLGNLADVSSYHFMEQDDFRTELLSWMRLRKNHPRWFVDGLNAHALKMSWLEAIGASFVLGPAFKTLKCMRLAKPLVSETSRFQNATALALLHRPVNETTQNNGRYFYRLWLEIERSGFKAQVIASLVDYEKSLNIIHEMANIPKDRTIVTAFLLGKPPENAIQFERARLPLDDILIN